MVDKAVRQRRRRGSEEVERDALERLALRAWRDVGGGAGWAAIPKNPD